MKARFSLMNDGAGTKRLERQVLAATVGATLVVAALSVVAVGPFQGPVSITKGAAGPAAALSDSDLRVYLVDSPQQADDLATGRLTAPVPPEDAVIVRSGSAEEGRWLRTGVPSIAIVDIVSADEDAAQTQARLNGIRRLQQATDQRPLRVVDLRGS